MKKFLRVAGYATAVLCLALSSCRKDDSVIHSHDDQKQDGDPSSALHGFYLLNEGNMGSNKASLDCFNYLTGVYSRNIYAERNPEVVKELGDVGNDLQVYGGKLYAVINCSNFVEIMDVLTGKHLGSVTIPNCRYMAFYDGKAYVSSYAGPVQIGNKQLGKVVEIDTTTFAVTREVTVGYNPEEMAIVDGRMYVPNSGGYLVPDYDNTVSVVDLATMTELRKIEVEKNLHHAVADGKGGIYLTGRGDYGDLASNLYLLDTATEKVVKTFNIPASEICLVGDSLYIINWTYSKATGGSTVGYTLLNTNTQTVVKSPFIAAEVADRIKVPYTVAVNPVTREIMVTDAGDYVSPGTLYYLNADGSLKWSETTGDIPAHVAFY